MSDGADRNLSARSMSTNLILDLCPGIARTPISPDLIIESSSGMDSPLTRQAWARLTYSAGSIGLAFIDFHRITGRLCKDDRGRL
jgi:hypothetical protein